jgi:hypothetical protein
MCGACEMLVLTLVHQRTGGGPPHDPHRSVVEQWTRPAQHYLRPADAPSAMSSVAAAAATNPVTTAAATAATAAAATATATAAATATATASADAEPAFEPLYEDIDLRGNLPVSSLALAGDTCLVYARVHDHRLFRLTCRASPFPPPPPPAPRPPQMRTSPGSGHTFRRRRRAQWHTYAPDDP